MSGRFSIQKGKRGERDVAKLLNPILERVCHSHGIPAWKLARNLTQTQSGGFDLDGLDWIAIEIKWHQVVTGKLTGWWNQAVRQAGDSRVPVLIYKANGTKWRVRLWTLITIDADTKRRLRVCSDITFDDFLTWFEKRVEVEAAKKRAAASDLPVATPGLFD